MQTRIVDLGWARIVKELKHVKGSYTIVGFPSNGTIAPPSKGGSEHEPISDMGTLVKIAMTHEYGGEKGIPARPFFRPAFDDNLDKVHRLQDAELSNLYAGKSTAALGLARIGEFLTSRIKAKIRSNIPPPLKPATIRRKGSTRTLVDRGQMINSVQHIEVIK